MASAPTQNPRVATDTWRANKALSLIFRLAIFMVPLIAGWLAVKLVSGLLYIPEGRLGIVVWALQAIIVGSAAATAVDHYSRRLLPLSTLYGISLVFPDEAPSRFGTALKLGSTKKLRAELSAIATDVDQGPQSPQRAAERALVLVAMLGQHDRLTRGHSERVRAYVDLIAQEMGLPEEDRMKLSWAALLHDVGKLKVPAEILNSASKPSAAEWELLVGHPGHSAELLRSLYDWLGDAFGAATEHHERWDGKGYPQQLRGEEISIAGRITAVADAFDTMTSVRSYKSAHSADSARRELVECSGGQFDPDVVRAFLNVSLGRRWMAGPLTWITEIPGLSANGLGAIPAAAASVVVAATATVGAITATEAPPPEQLASVETPELIATPEITFSPTTSAPVIKSQPEIPPTTTPVLTTTTAPTITSTTTPATTTPATTAPATTARPKTSTPATTAAPTTAAPTTGTPTTAQANNAVARTDTYVVEAEDMRTFRVLDNDDPGDFNWDYSTLSFYSDPSHAETWRVARSSPRLKYMAEEDYEGPDSFKYVICNTGGQCVIGQVNITVVDD